MPDPEEQQKRTVSVEKGDTLSEIAQREGMGASRWEDIGGIPDHVREDPRQLQPGTELTIPQQEEVSVDPIDDELDAEDITRGEQIEHTTLSEEERWITSMTGQVDRERARIEERFERERERVRQEREELEQERQQIMDKQEELSEPFREDLQEKKREELYIRENFEETQNLVNEMESLLQEGNDLIQQQKEVTGLQAVRNPRVQKTMDEVTARAGVIESVINARQGQIAQAQTMIDRTMGAIQSDRQDQLNYYQTVLNLHNKDILRLDQESERLAQEQTNLIKHDLERAEQTSNMIKEMMMDPATAGFMGKAGVSLNDSPQEVAQKISQAQYQEQVAQLDRDMREQGAQPVADPTQVPDNQLQTVTDSRGNEHYYKVDPERAFSTSTLRTLEGQSLNDLTPSRRQEVEDELYEAGLSPYRSQPTEEFRSIMEEIMGTELGDDDLQEQWEEYRQIMLEDEEEDDEDEVTDETTAGEYFTDTQIAQGASAAGMTISEFRQLGIDEANEYIYGDDDDDTTVDDISR